jgi:hypothetical protein
MLGAPGALPLPAEQRLGASRVVDRLALLRSLPPRAKKVFQAFLEGRARRRSAGYVVAAGDLACTQVLVASHGGGKAPSGNAYRFELPRGLVEIARRALTVTFRSHPPARA